MQYRSPGPEASENTASIEVRDCGLGLHADQTAEVVCIQAAFYFKGLVFPIRMLWEPDCIAEKANKRQLGNILLKAKQNFGLQPLDWLSLGEEIARVAEVAPSGGKVWKEMPDYRNISDQQITQVSTAPKWVPILGSGSP